VGGISRERQWHRLLLDVVGGEHAMQAALHAADRDKRPLHESIRKQVLAQAQAQGQE
jgi:hypothetical protein